MKNLLQLDIFTNNIHKRHHLSSLNLKNVKIRSTTKKKHENVNKLQKSLTCSSLNKSYTNMEAENVYQRCTNNSNSNSPIQMQQTITKIQTQNSQLQIGLLSASHSIESPEKSSICEKKQPVLGYFTSEIKKIIKPSVLEFKTPAIYVPICIDDENTCLLHDQKHILLQNKSGQRQMHKHMSFQQFINKDIQAGQCITLQNSCKNSEKKFKDLDQIIEQEKYYEENDIHQQLICMCISMKTQLNELMFYQEKLEHIFQQNSKNWNLLSSIQCKLEYLQKEVKDYNFLFV